MLYKGEVIKEFARGEATKADVMFWVSGGREVAVAATGAAQDSVVGE